MRLNECDTPEIEHLKAFAPVPDVKLKISPMSDTLLHTSPN